MPESGSATGQAQERLRITEIFYSLQGETRTTGWPTVFIRLTGCPLRCTYCDTTYAFQGGKWVGLDQILQQTAEHSAHYVTVTGGEPLAQKSCISLLTALCDAGYEVSLETSGAMDISPVDSRVVIVMDLKTPSSGEEQKNIYANISLLKSTDQIKFVIANRQDYQWSVDIVNKYNLSDKFEVLFSSVQGELLPRDLAEWILEDKLQVRMQLQLHKILWGDVPGH